MQGASRPVAATRLLGLCLSLALFALAVRPAHAWRQMSELDYSANHAQISVQYPTELADPLAFAVTGVGGPMFLAEAPDFQYAARFMLPHSEDMAHRGCDPFVHTVNDEGESIEDAFLLIKRGGCYYSDKIARAQAMLGPNNRTVAAVVIYGCEGCDETLLPMAIYEHISVPAIYIAGADGRTMEAYLLARRAAVINATVDGVFTQPPACSDPINTQSSAAASAAGCVVPRISGFGIGTGELVDPAEKEALLTLAGAITFDESLFDYDTWLRVWSDFVEHPDVDPCTSRITGLWCERNHVVSLDLGALGLTGTLPPGSFAALSQLRVLLVLDNKLTGPLPNDLCALTALVSFSGDTNSLTAIPECIGGGWFADAAGVNTTYPGAQALHYFSASNNLLGNLPASFSRLASTLFTLAMYNNKVVAPFDKSLFGMHQLRVCELHGNPGLVWDWDALPAGETATFGSWTNVYSLVLRNTGFRGRLPVDAFDGCAALAVVDISSTVPLGGLYGELPHFIGCKALSAILMREGAFVGGVPESWPTELTGLLTLNLEKNQVGAVPGSFDALSSMPQLRNVYLSSNNISGSDPDAGASFFNMMPNSIVIVNLDNNQFSGPWADGWLTQKNLVSINFARNRIQNLPPDLFFAKLTAADFSFNELSGSLPSLSPSVVANPITGAPAWTQFSIEGNTGLTVDELPDWLQYSNPPRYALSSDEAYLCRELVSISETLHITVDPTFTKFQGCLCVRGSFGLPPLCPLLPQSAVISPYELPQSSEIGNDFTHVIGFNSSAEELSPVNKTYSTEFVQHPHAFSDSWYGENRFTSGMGTHWEVDLSRLLLSTPDLLRETRANVTVLAAKDGASNGAGSSVSTASLDDPFQAVRVITVRVHLSRADFDSDSTVSVFSGDSTGTRVGVISGKERARINALPLSSAYTSTPDYQAAYGQQIAELNDPVLLEIQVLNPRATVSFESRSTSGVHFLSTYSYSFRCPEGYELPSAEMAAETSDSCVQPTLGATSSVLILLLGIGGALVAFAFIWLMYERFQRQKAANLLTHQSVAGKSEQASDEDLQSDAARLFTTLRDLAYQRLVKEIAFEIISLVWEVVSTILNWVVVGQVLAAGTSSLSNLSVGYIIVVVISTFAVGANGISRVTGLMLLRTQVHHEAAYKTRVQRMSTEMNNGGKEGIDEAAAGDVSDMKTEADVRQKIEEVTRRLNRLKIAALSLALHGLPFIILNLLTLYDGNTDDSHGSEAVTVQISLLMSFLLIGMKLQDMKDWPNQNRLLATNQLSLVQIRLKALHSGADSRRVTRRTRGGASTRPSEAAQPPAATGALVDAPAHDDAVSSPVSPAGSNAVVDVDEIDAEDIPGPPTPEANPRARSNSAMETTDMEMATL